MTDLTDQLDAIKANAAAVKGWQDTDMDARRNLNGLIRALDHQRGDVAFLLGLARKQQAAIDAVKALHREVLPVDESVESMTICDECERLYPCPTIKALEAKP